MAMVITIELSDLDEKCMKYICVEPETFIKNLVESRVFSAKQEIYNHEIKRMTADPNVMTIPANIDDVVMQAEVTYANANPPLPDVTPPNL